MSGLNNWNVYKDRFFSFSKNNQEKNNWCVKIHCIVNDILHISPIFLKRGPGIIAFHKLHFSIKVFIEFKHFNEILGLSNLRVFLLSWPSLPFDLSLFIRLFSASYYDLVHFFFTQLLVITCLCSLVQYWGRALDVRRQGPVLDCIFIEIMVQSWTK